MTDVGMYCSVLGCTGVYRDVLECTGGKMYYDVVVIVCIKCG